MTAHALVPQPAPASPPRPSAARLSPPAAPVLRRACSCGGTPGPSGECESCRRKRVQRAASAAGPGVAPPIVHDVLRSAGAPLDAGTRAQMEPRFGHSFADVRVHADGAAAQSARAVGAHAYAVGRDVVFGAGRYAPGSAEGRRLIAHELAHVVQQRGSASASLQPRLEVGAADDPAEREADRAADAVLAGGGMHPLRTGGAGLLRRTLLHNGSILDEGSCEHLACNSRWGCGATDTGVKCPDGTRNAFTKTSKLYTPLFTCDSTCEKATEKGCDDNAHWMAWPGATFGRGKCGKDLVLCANGKFTHGQVRDKSEKDKAWEVSHGIQDALDVSPYAKFTGSIYSDENDAGFKTDARCGNKKAKDTPKKKADGTPGKTSGRAPGDAGAEAEADPGFRPGLDLVRRDNPSDQVEP